ncbi:MAG: hypothetical protein ABF296_07090 [Oceanococcaceae bacterium]
MRFPLVIAPLVLMFTACSDSGNGLLGGGEPPVTDDATVAVVALRAADFSSGAHAVIRAADNTIDNNLDPDGSDMSIRADRDGFFRVGRLFGGSDANAISRYTLDNPGLPQSTYSTQDAARPDEGSNPYDIIRISDDRAYVLRYGSARLWVVDPEASSEIGFKKGEIDLSAFDSDGIPEMVAGVIAAGRVWVVLQRLTNFSADRDSMLVAIDTATNTLVDLDLSTAAVDGLTLPVRNAVDIRVSNDGASLLVLGIGSADFDAQFNATPRYDGGLVQVDLANLNTRLLLDDGTSENAPFGQFAAFTQDRQDTLWLIAGDADFGGADRLFRIDPSAATASTAGLPQSTQNVEISTLAASPAGDLWLGLAGNNPGLLRFDPRTGATQPLLLNLVPINIDFVIRTDSAAVR